jgi:acetolactate synthase-1/3 small subunit
LSTAQHTITALVQNEAGTLNRLVSLFRRRGFSLASMNAGDCEQEGFSRLTIVVNGDDRTLNQCVTQLEKLIDVVEVDDLKSHECLRRELALVKFQSDSQQRREALEVVHVLGGKVAHLAVESMTVEFIDDPIRIDRMISLLQPLGVVEVVRTGLVAIRVEDDSRRKGQS